LIKTLIDALIQVLIISDHHPKLRRSLASIITVAQHYQVLLVAPSARQRGHFRKFTAPAQRAVNRPTQASQSMCL